MKVKISSTVYDLKLDTELTCNCEDESFQAYGWCDERGEIAIDYTYSNQVKQQTLWHELTHAFLNEIGNDKLSSNEDFVIAFSKQLYSFYRDNNIDKIYDYLESKKK